MATPNQSVDISAGLVPIQNTAPPAANNPVSPIPSNSVTGTSSAAPDQTSNQSANQPAPDGIDLSAGLIPKDQAAAEQPAKAQPGFFQRAYETSGIKSMVDAAKARADEDEAVRSEALAHIKSSNWGGATEVLLHHLAKRAGTAALGPGGEMIAGAAQASYQHGKAAIQAARSGKTGEAIVQSAEAVPLVGPVAAQIGEPLGEDLRNENWSGAAGDVVSGGAQAALALLGGKAAEGGEARSAVSAEESAAKGLPLKEAGQQVQSEARAIRDFKGKEVGAVKEAVAKSLPSENPTAVENHFKQRVDDKGLVSGGSWTDEGLRRDFDLPENVSLNKQAEQGVIKRNSEGLWELSPKTRGAGSGLSLPKDGNLSKTAKSVLDEVDSTNQLAGAKDPDMADVEAMAKHLSEGKNAQGEPLSADPKQADSINRAFRAKIDALQAKADTGGNATALRHVKQLKAAYSDDLFDTYEKHGDPDAAQNLRTLNKEYAKIVSDQTSGPAKAMLRNASPEKIVSTIVSNGAKSQSAVESLMRNMSEDGQVTLRDSVLKEIYRRNTLPDGTIDMAKAQKAFNGMGDAAKTLFGDSHADTSKFLDAAATKQAAKNKPSLLATKARATARMAGAGAGAAAFGTPGAVAGEAAMDALFQQGRSGAVKIGISPTERIVLSPAEVVAKRPLITKFLNAKNVPALTAAYNALKAGGDQPSTENGQTDQPAARNPQKSSGGSLGAILSGGTL